MGNQSIRGLRESCYQLPAALHEALFEALRQRVERTFHHLAILHLGQGGGNGSAGLGVGLVGHGVLQALLDDRRRVDAGFLAVELLYGNLTETLGALGSLLRAGALRQLQVEADHLAFADGRSGLEVEGQVVAAQYKHAGNQHEQ